MKSYTDIEQSKKLTEILPLESADMKILSFGMDIKRRVVPIDDIAVLNREDEIPCWSIAALMNFFPIQFDWELKTYSFNMCIFYMYGTGEKYYDLSYQGSCGNLLYVDSKNLVDACYEMILKLHELNLL